jgi:L,D-transpeptidase YcbB
MSGRAATLALITLTAAFGCRSGGLRTSEEVRHLVEAAPRTVDTEIWADVQRFYAARRYARLWTDGSGSERNTERALALAAAAEQHGLDPERYRLAGPELVGLAPSDADATSGAERRARFDVALTTAVLRLARDVATGAIDPREIDRSWNAERTAPDLVAALLRTFDKRSPTIAAYLADVAPRHPEYVALQHALAGLKQQRAEQWAAVPYGILRVHSKARVARSDVSVAALRRRLAGQGYLSQVDGGSYDEAVRDAVRRFQDHYGVKATGRVDEATLRALNVPLPQRIAQVEATLERWRWMPDDLGSRHLLVNVPSFELVAREGGRRVMDIRVVVGKRGNETPLFSDQMTHLVFSPYWNIPETIALAETVPAVVRDPEYLSRNNMEVVTASGRVVPEETIPWDDVRALKRLSFRQRPGRGNALGHVKFMFPNQHNVYIHDTPADALFARVGRAFSHGCVRVEEPEALARYLLREQPQWTPQAILAAMRAGEERHVKLVGAIPVHIVYFTAWVDANGGLHFRDDVYGYDARQSRTTGRRDRSALIADTR